MEIEIKIQNSRKLEIGFKIPKSRNLKRFGIGKLEQKSKIHEEV